MLQTNEVGSPPIDLLLQMSCATDYEDFLSFLDPATIDHRAGIGKQRATAIV